MVFKAAVLMVTNNENFDKIEFNSQRVEFFVLTANMPVVKTMHKKEFKIGGDI